MKVADAALLRKHTYDIHDLRARYSCAASTIYRMMNNDGYPRPSRLKKGSRNVWAMIAVHAWEVTHMPFLHAASDEQFVVDDSDTWRKIRAGYEGQLLKDTTGRPKPLPKKRWEDVQREGKEVIAAIKKRHGTKSVAPRT